jgi:hypothetical protein
MNASKVKSLCGSRASKTGKGAKGMSTKEIEKFVKEKLPKNLQDEFKRMQKKDRLSLCVLLSKFKNGQELLQKNATPPKKVTKKTNDPFEEAAKAAKANRKSPKKGANNGRMNFQVTNENGNTNSNSPNKEVEGYGGNSPNNQENRRRAAGKANYAAIRRAEPDPAAKGMKLKGKLKGQMNARLRRLKRMGKLPEGKTMANVLKNEMTKKPKDFKKGAMGSVRKASPVKKVKGRGYINFGKGASKATARRTTQSIPAAYKTRGLSMSQIAAAKRAANAKVSNLNRAGLLPNAANKSFEAEMNALRRELLNDQLDAMEPNRNGDKAKPITFNAVRSNVDVNAELSTISKMKAGNKTPSIKRKERIFKVLKRMRPNKPAFTRPTKLVPNMTSNSPNNSPNNDKVGRGLNASDNRIRNLKNKKSRGEKLTSPERKLLNVVNALRN